MSVTAGPEPARRSRDSNRVARTPVAAPAAAAVGIVVAVLFIGIGLVGVRDALVRVGVLGGRSWTGSAAGRVEGLTPGWWMVPAGIGAALIGLWLIVLAVKPRRRTAVLVSAGCPVWIRPRDIARIAAYTAGQASASLDASAAATRRAVTVTVTTIDADAESVRHQVSDAVAVRLEALAEPPRIRVRPRVQAGTR